MLRLKDTNKLNTQYTYMTEIIYPENHIVTDYGNMEDLILLEVIPLDANEVVYRHVNTLLSTVFTADSGYFKTVNFSRVNMIQQFRILRNSTGL